MHVSEKRFWVKICAGRPAGGNPCIYHRTGLPFETFMKFQWLFKYRAALYQVKNPRHHVSYETGSYDYVAPKDEVLKTLKNKIIAKKRLITQWENSIALGKQTWCELFPIEDDADFKRAMEKVNKNKFELQVLEQQLSAL